MDTPELQRQWKKVEGTFLAMTKVTNSGGPRPGMHELMNSKHEFEQMATKSGNYPEIYKSAKYMIINHLTQRVTTLSFSVSGEELLHAVYEAWHSHQAIVKWSEFTFGCLNSRYVNSTDIHEGVEPIKRMAMRCFLTAVFDQVKGRLCSILMDQVRRERQGDSTNRNVLKESVELYMEMGMGDNLALYRREFEGPFLQQTSEFYGGQASKWLSEEGGMHTFLEQADRHIREEEARAKAYLNISSRKPLLNLLREVLLHAHSEAVMHDPGAGFQTLLANWKVDGIARMFRLFSQVPNGRSNMCKIILEYTKGEGKALNEKLTTGGGQNEHVEAVISLWGKYVNLFREHCQDQQGRPDAAMLKALRDAFDVFFNESVTIKESKGPEGKAQETTVKLTSSEMLSNFCDLTMKNDKLDPHEFEATLGQIMDLFSVIQDKELFWEHHRRAMSKRLLIATKDFETLVENEAQLIGKFKVKMGPNFTHKLETMLADKASSANAIKDFAKWLEVGGAKAWIYDFTPSVLTQGHWPSLKDELLVLPDVLEAPKKCFEQYYHSRNSSRKLAWPNSVGTGSVVRTFGNTKEIGVSTLQMCVLLETNDHPAISLRSLVEGALKMDKDDAKRTIASLAFRKFVLLKKKDDTDKKKTVGEADEFIVNDGFRCQSRKFRVPIGQAKVVTGDAQEATDKNRSLIVDAAIVRVMKGRKTLSHQELNAELTRQLKDRFVPDYRLIKLRIQDLIAREYLVRHADDRNMYDYLA